MAEVVIPYKPRKWARELHDTKKRWVLMVIHRRGGKTTAELNHLQRTNCEIAKSQTGYIGPTYKQAKRIAWDIAKDMSRPIPGTDRNESELILKYPNASKLFLAGSENPDSIRGIPLWGVAHDEYSLQQPTIFSSVTSKCLADHLGYGLFSGTPKGKNEFWRLFEAANKSSDWTVIFRTIEDSLRDEEGETIQNLRVAVDDDKRLVDQGLMTQDEFDQEWYCSFNASVKGSYYGKEISKTRADGRVKAVPHDARALVHTVWDLGIGANLAVGFYQKFGNEVHMIDFEQGLESDAMPEMFAKLQRKPYVYGKHFAPHDINAREMMTGKTRIDTAKELGINFEPVPKVSVESGIEKGKLFFSRLWINDPGIPTPIGEAMKGVPYWLDAVLQYKQQYDEDNKIFMDKPIHDWTSHPADVHRYAALVEDLMTNDDIPMQQSKRMNANETRQRTNSTR